MRMVAAALGLMLCCVQARADAQQTGTVRICPTPGIYTGPRHDMLIPSGTLFVDAGREGDDSGDGWLPVSLLTTADAILKARQKCTTAKAVSRIGKAGLVVGPQAHRRYAPSGSGHMAAGMENLSAFPTSVFQ